ncbi:PD-(D/E)XK motif protein [Mucilaginibacter sp. L196]|uniref:PD-(D/E)XK motif protein n=1 Tax=Mucilaginibacter sp. L196 TaxID=1641870 RepID=UPI00131C4BB6|nr:PD-(D/E)XK motif protein [Mucilaginibacter sp. L196]
MKIKDIWLEQESDPVFSAGLMLKGFGGTFLPQVFIGLISPGRCRCIAASISMAISIDLNHYLGLQDLEIELKADTKNTDRNYLIFKLTNPVHNDIFSVLCEDLISSIANVSNERTLVKELFNRFENWNTLFKRAPGDWLTPESQRGLYGELHFLREFLNANSEHYKTVNSWVGCEMQVRDFQTGGWAVEVKTTKGNNHQKVHINGERQLDTTNLDQLFLYHLSLEVLQQSGETLNAIILSICELLSADLVAFNRFKTKLMFSGYREEDSHHYDDSGYLIRDQSFYKVEGSFPRIQESDLRKGLGDIHYSIILSNCTDYITDSTTVFNTTTFS